MSTDKRQPAQSLDSLTPRQIVEELDRYVVGQRDAKRLEDHLPQEDECDHDDEGHRRRLPGGSRTLGRVEAIIQDALVEQVLQRAEIDHLREDLEDLQELVQDLIRIENED